MAKPAKMAPATKYGGKDRCVPAGNHTDGEVEADDRVHREHERCGKSGQQKVSGFVSAPMPRRAAPAHGQHAVDETRNPLPAAVAQRRQIGNQSDKPEQQGNRSVSRNRKDIPHQWAPKLRPDAHRVRIGKQPINRQPGSAGVKQRIHGSARHGEQRHCFSKTVDRRSPFLPQQQAESRKSRCRHDRCRSTRQN